MAIHFTMLVSNANSEELVSLDTSGKNEPQSGRAPTESLRWATGDCALCSTQPRIAPPAADECSHPTTQAVANRRNNHQPDR